MKKGIRAAVGVAAVAAVIMLALGRAQESRVEIVSAADRQYYGISMDRYREEMAAAAREEELLTKSSPKREVYSLSAESEEMLLKIAMAEAGGEDLEGKALVMCVVMNRIRDKEFPNTVAEVIFQARQFSPVSDGRYYDMVPDEQCYIALNMVTSGWDESQGATYFRTNVSESTWHSEALEYLFTHGNHSFYREK